MPKTCASVALLAGGASTWLASRAFVATPPVGDLSQQNAGLRGAVPMMDRGATDSAAGFGSSATCALLLGAAAVGASRVARRAEPVSAAAAAAAAAKAAGAAKAATKVGAGVAGAAAMGGATKGGAEGVAGKENPKPNFDPTTQLGAMAPLGYFDPAGFCKKGDENGFRTFRAAEIKHGRVAMMAAVGAVIQHYVKFPGFEKVPTGLSAVSTAPGSYGMIALFLAAGALELGPWSENPNKEPGNFGDPVGLNQYNEDMRSKEINNGRMAMFAALGIIAGELLTGKDGVEQLGGV